MDLSFILLIVYRSRDNKCNYVSGSISFIIIKFITYLQFNRIQTYIHTKVSRNTDSILQVKQSYQITPQIIITDIILITMNLTEITTQIIITDL